MNYFKKIKWCLKPQVLHWLLCLSSDCDGGFPGGASGKEPACQFRRCKHTGSIPELVRTPGEGYSNPLQYSCLENPKDRGAWQATVHEVAKSETGLTLSFCSTDHCLLPACWEMPQKWPHPPARAFQSLERTVRTKTKRWTEQERIPVGSLQR